MRIIEKKVARLAGRVHPVLVLDGIPAVSATFKPCWAPTGRGDDQPVRRQSVHLISSKWGLKAFGLGYNCSRTVKEPEAFNTMENTHAHAPAPAEQRAARLALPRWRSETFVLSQLARRAGLDDTKAVRAIDAGRSFWAANAAKMSEGLEVAGVSRFRQAKTTGHIRFRGGKVTADEGWQLAVLRLASDVRLASKTLGVPERGLLEFVLDNSDLSVLTAALAADYQ